MSWLDITDDLTLQGQEALKVGQVLMFDFEGSAVHLKIMRKRYGKVWAMRTRLFTVDEADEEVMVVNNVEVPVDTNKDWNSSVTQGAVGEMRHHETENNT